MSRTPKDEEFSDHDVALMNLLWDEPAKTVAHAQERVINLASLLGIAVTTLNKVWTDREKAKWEKWEREQAPARKRRKP